MSRVAKAIESDLDEYFETLDYIQDDHVLDMVVRMAEKTTIAYVLEKTQGNQSRAAAILGVSRNTLHKKIALYEL